jgi:hypothetical protein
LNLQSEVAPIVAEEDAIFKRMPSPTHLLTPTLVFVCGVASEEEVKSLEDNVLQRLGSNTPPEAVHWAQIPSRLFEREQGALEQIVEGLVRPCLTQQYVEGLWEDGFLREMPSPEHPFELQVVVLYQLGSDNAPDPVQCLKSLEIALQKSVSTRAKPSFVLIVVGEHPLDLGQDTLYWPRFRIQAMTYGQLEAASERIQEACQNLLVSLITSELCRVIDDYIGKNRATIGWMWVGASALTVDLKGMREFVRFSVLRDLIKPMVATELTTTIRPLVEQETQGKLEALQTCLLAAALKIASRLGWDTKPPEKTLITEMNLQSDAKLRGKLFKPASDLSGIASDQFKTGILSEHYKDLRDVLTRELAAQVNQEYAQLCKYFELLMEPLPEPSPKEIVLLKADVAPAPIPKNSQDQNVPPEELSLEKTRHRGLGVAACAVRKAEDFLKRSSDVERPGLHTHRIGNDDYLNSVGDLDENALCMADLRQRRLYRAILSRRGFVLKLLPAWSLLTALFTFARLDEWQAAIIGGLLLALLGLYEYFQMQSQLQKLRARLVCEIEQQILGSALGILTRVLRDYRLLMVARLGEIAQALDDLERALRREEKESRARTDKLEEKFKGLDASGKSVYWLADLAQCRDWVGYAMRDAQIRRLEFKNIVAAEILPKREPPSYRHILNEQSKYADNLATQNFNDAMLQPFALAESQPLLQAGKRWEWLYQKAQPLGGSCTHEEFGIIGIGPGKEGDAAVSGPDGAKSEYWRAADFWGARSRQAHEIACVRIAVERV